MTNRPSLVLAAICTGAFLVLSPLFLLQVQGVTAVEDIDPEADASSCVDLTVNMRYRSTDAQTGGQVSLLQDFLQGRDFLNNEPTGFLGLLTFQAVKNFQMSVSISPTGFVGPITREKIKELTCEDGTNLIITLRAKSDNFFSVTGGGTVTLEDLSKSGFENSLTAGNRTDELLLLSW